MLSVATPGTTMDRLYAEDCIIQMIPHAPVALLVEMSTSTKEEMRDKSEFATRCQIALFRLYVRRPCSQYTLPLTLSRGLAP